MKSRIILILTLAIVVLDCEYASAQKASKQKPAISNTRFTGVWKGTEKCKGVSAPVAIVTISTATGTEVYLSGIYSIQGTVKGTVKGDTITIPRQEVEDPNFTNMLIEGALALAGSPSSMQGTVHIQNNQQVEECYVKYNK